MVAVGTSSLHCSAGGRPISENTVNVALKAMGYSGDQITGHGFRAMASTRLNEMGVPPDAIELQLTHAERNEVRAVYKRAKRIAERRRMMQDWAEYLLAGPALTGVANANSTL
jgi:integrase